jgi:hypothetical protein
MHPIRSSASRSLAIMSAIVLTALIAMSSHASAAPSVLTPSPTTWDYGNADIHTGGPGETFTFTNSTPGLVTVSGVGVVGTDASAFQVNSNGCTFNILGTGGSCTVQVNFNPTSSGVQTAALEITDDSGTLDVPLSGTGITGTLSAIPNAVAFTPQPWFNGGQQQNISIQDSNDAGVVTTSAVITGPDAAVFSVGWGQNCGTQPYAPGTTCGMGINFNPPNGPGVFHAQLEIRSDSLSSPLIIPLTATALNGPVAVVTPSQTDFGDVAIGTAVARTVTVANHGDYPMQVQGTLLITGTPSDLSVTSDGCSGQAVTVGATCQFTVTYRPSAARQLNAAVLLLTNGPGAPTPTGFSGEGVPAVNGSVTVNGQPAAGSTLTCVPAGYPTGTSFTYEWLHNGHLVAGPTPPQLLLRDSDVGDRVTCRITATNSVSTQTVTSSPSSVVAPMSLTGESGAFTDVGTCRSVETSHLVHLDSRAVAVSYGSPVTPWAPLRLGSTTPLRVRIDGRVVGADRVVTIGPQTLSSFAEGPHELTVTGGGATGRGRLVLAACALAVRLDGGPAQAATLSASSRYGVRTLTFRLSSGLYVAAGRGRILGWATITTAGYPSRGFALVGPRTESNAVTVSVSAHSLTVTNLPPRTGVFSVTLRAGVLSGRGGVVRLTAGVRGSAALLRASTPATWLG